MPLPSDRPRLTYIDAVMYETLRHATVAPYGLHHSNINNEILGGFDVPANSIVSYNIWAVHHDKDYWKNPEVFDPERWLNDDGSLKNHSNHFIAFGLGPRVCLGESLARVEYFHFLVALLHRFSFRLSDDFKNVSLDDGVAGATHAPPVYELIAEKR